MIFSVLDTSWECTHRDLGCWMALLPDHSLEIDHYSFQCSSLEHCPQDLSQLAYLLVIQVHQEISQ